MTNDQLHKELLSLHKTLLGIQSQLVKMEQLNLQAVKAVDDHEKRLRELERMSNHTKGALAVYAVAIAGAVSVVHWIIG